MTDTDNQRLQELGDAIDNILEFESIFARANDELTKVIQVYENQIESYELLCESYKESIRVLEAENEALLKRLQWRKIER
jgi:hypothetical protein